MRSVSLVVLLVLLFAFTDALKTKKQKKEDVYVQLQPDEPIVEPRYVKVPKPLTEYDKCKLECKKQRDAVNRKEHITALREQLAALEAEEAAAANAGVDGATASGESSEHMSENVGVPRS
ncbi:hypothetical protein RB195_000137 [Necator americanus]|uniref:Uncharacterized protein n=1 Tax=Necator americanus TaxID=51031 RepID=A0ABR1D849_NECAM